MSAGVAVLSTTGGVVLVLAMLRDIFHELLHPVGSGTLSRSLQRLVWRVARHFARRRRGILLLAGPTTLVVILMVWGLVLVVGWALIFWPFLPDHFRFASPLTPSGSFSDALYFSALALTTLGFGDVTPTTTVLRLLVTIEAAVGFALLTAGISWILSIYPVLSRRRALAQGVTQLTRAQRDTGCTVFDADPTVAASVLFDLATALGRVRTDLMQSGISYYFADRDAPMALPLMLPHLARLAAAGAGEAEQRNMTVRLAAASLRVAVGAYASSIGRDHLRVEECVTDEILVRYASDHLWTLAPTERGVAPRPS